MQDEPPVGAGLLFHLVLRTISMLTTQKLVAYLDDRVAGEAWLREIGVTGASQAYGNFARLATSGIPLDLLTRICQVLERELRAVSDPNMAIENLARFVEATRSPLSLAALFERDAEALPTLMRMFSTSQHLSDLMIAQPETFDLLRLTEGTPVSRDILVEELCSEIRAVRDERNAMHLLRSFKRRESARIVYGDVICSQRLETVTRQISFLAETICEAALVSAHATLTTCFGTPRGSDGNPARLAVLALGKLGGLELNYSSDIDLIFVYDQDGNTDGDKSISNQEYFTRLVKQFVKLVSELTDRGYCYQVDLRLRPEGDAGPLAQNAKSTFQYYDERGRTWERQAFVKARPIAGDAGLGESLLSKLSGWVYRRYLTRADITGIKALKRRIEKNTDQEGETESNVKSGRGGIRDIEFTIQFLQLLHGADAPSIRTSNTLEAIARLEEVGCLTMQERTILEENYAFLRKIEHRLQIMYDLQTHTLPAEESARRKFARRLGFTDQPTASARDQFEGALRECTGRNRKILDHVLHDAFPDDTSTDAIADLILDPTPSSDTIAKVLTPYGFRETMAAYRNLCGLSQEKISFLSTRRCRHFFAAIAPALLASIGATPNPDQTLENLAHVSDSLGGKGILWELFSANSPSLELYVRMCAGSPYLCSLLTSNPGMIDELMDSLVLGRLPKSEQVFQSLAELCRGADDIEPILHSFKNSMHLRIGVRDILGKEDVRNTTASLADTAEACLQQITLREYQRMVSKYGTPTLPASLVAHDQPASSSIHVPPYAHLPDRPGLCELVVLAVGKLGGREPNYHSDLDVIFLYQADGETRRRGRGEGQTTSNLHFYSELGQRIVKSVTKLENFGRLYEMDPRLRPTGQGGYLAVSFEEFSRYFAQGHGQLWERQALTKARPIFGSALAREQAMRRVFQIVTEPPWNDGFAVEIADMREQMQETASPHNLKRGHGGTVDIEFILQMLQLRHAAESPEVLVPGTLQAIEQLRRSGILSEKDASYFTESYRYLRTVESRLRLMNREARHDLPQHEDELARLAYLLNDDSSENSLARCGMYRHQNRVRFERLFAMVTN